MYKVLFYEPNEEIRVLYTCKFETRYNLTCIAETERVEACVRSLGAGPVVLVSDVNLKQHVVNFLASLHYDSNGTFYAGNVRFRVVLTTANVEQKTLDKLPRHLTEKMIEKPLILDLLGLRIDHEISQWHKELRLAQVA